MDDVGNEDKVMEIRTHILNKIVNNLVGERRRLRTIGWVVTGEEIELVEDRRSIVRIFNTVSGTMRKRGGRK